MMTFACPVPKNFVTVVHLYLILDTGVCSTKYSLSVCTIRHGSNHSTKIFNFKIVPLKLANQNGE
jgi:hypothetical protein